MASPVVARTRIPKIALWMGALALAAILAAVVYLERPRAKPVDESGATPEAKAYVSQLELSGVNMVASENFMQQKVVEIQGTIANRGTRPRGPTLSIEDASRPAKQAIRLPRRIYLAVSS